MSNVIISKRERDVYHEDFCPYANQIQKRYRKYIDEDEAIKRGYRECKFCHSVRGIVYKYKKTTDYQVFYDPMDDAFCVKTLAGFWKLIWRENNKVWHVFHMNHKGWKAFNPELPAKVLMRGSFHRQDDIHQTGSVAKILSYIFKHDKAYQQAETDIRQMKKTTHKQRVSYRKQKCRKKREQIRTVFKIFNQLEKEKKNDEASAC